MAFDIDRFYQQLDASYAARDNAATEQFLQQQRQKAYEDGLVQPANEGCPACVPPLEPNMAFVSVCNEQACFYRGLSRWKESLEAFSAAQRELEQLYRHNTPEYAVVLLNKAGTYRYMGDLEQALTHFARAEAILAADEKTPPDTLAGLYNNIGLVYLDQKNFEKAAEALERALPLLGDGLEHIVELGSTYNNLAVAYNGLGRAEAAHKAVEAAVALLGQLDEGNNPHYPAALNTRGMFYYRAGQYQQALADFEAAVEKTEAVYGQNIEYAGGCANCAAACQALGLTEQAAEWQRRDAETRARLQQA